MDLNKNDLMKGLFGESNKNDFGQSLPEVDERKIVKIPLEFIDDLKSDKHAYEKSLNMGLGIDELANQIKEVGQQQPAVVRKKENGRYETIIGHRRKRACILADKKTLDAIIIDCSDDEAAIISTDNLGQRPLTFPSEIAKAYKIQIEAIKRQGKRTDLIKKIDDINFGQKLPEVEEDNSINNFGQKLPEVDAREYIAQKYKMSARKVSNYLRLNELIDDLADMVDYHTIPLMSGVYLSYLSQKQQTDLADILKKNANIRITIDIAKELKHTAEEMAMAMNYAIIEATVNPPDEDITNDFRTKTIKPAYKIAFKNIEKYIKKIDNYKAEKLIRADENELEIVIKEAIDKYLDNL